MDYEVSDIAARVVRADGEHTDFAVKATVKNQSGDEDVHVEIQGVDGDGFEIYEVTLQGSVPVGTTKILTDKQEYVETSVYEQIHSWQFKNAW